MVRICELILATPAPADRPITASIRSSLLSTLFDNIRPLYMSGVASSFVALVAFIRLQNVWTALWLLADLCLAATRVGIALSYLRHNRAEPVHPGRWATLYVPATLLACLLLGMGTMACLMVGDPVLAPLTIMVTAGILGGIASRNAALPRLAITQICLGAAPIALGALIAQHSTSLILFPPLCLYVAAMMSVVKRHYAVLVALMTAEQRHAELAARFDAALAHMPHGLCTIDTEDKVVIANRRTAELFGSTMEMLRLNVPLPEFIGNVGLPKFGETLRTRLVERCQAWLDEEHGTLEMKLNDGRQLEMTRNMVPDGSAVIIIEDVTQWRNSEAEILHLARHDALTGLPNRRHMCDRLQLILLDSAVNARPGPSVMYLDLDGFKQVNDQFGHHAGDVVLKSVADRLREVLPHDGFAARFGGDEFAIISTAGSLADIKTLASRIIDCLSEPYSFYDGGLCTVGASVGIAFAQAGESFESLLHRADVALYSAKNSGKGTFHISQASTSSLSLPRP